MLKRFALLRVLPFLVVWLLRGLDLTWRYRELHAERWTQRLADSRPTVVAFLHGRTFTLIRRMTQRRNGRFVSMCSKSLDGEAMARVEEALGLEVVRGSSGTDGLQAIVDMIKRIRRDPSLGSCLAVDGSRGPRGFVQGGIVKLAAHTGGVIQPLTASARPAFIFRKAWDRTLMPWPFARVVIAYGRPIEVPARPSPEQTEQIRRRVESELIALQAEADEASGLADEAGVQARAESTSNAT